MECVTACPVCGHEEVLPFWEAERAPAVCNRLCDSEAEARRTARAPIKLALCRRCGVAYNHVFDARQIEYSGEYENALHFSSSFRDYAQQLAEDLVARHDLHGKQILEIGCGDGQFLQTLCQAGGNRGLGLDPAHNSARVPASATAQVEIRDTAFDQAVVAQAQPDMICCRHVLEHIPKPLAFLREVRRAIGDRASAAVYFEVPNLLYTLKHMGVWDIIYEHCFYFTPAALTRLFRAAGFEPVNVDERYGGQFIGIEARPGKADPQAAHPEDELRRIEWLAVAFRDRYQQKVATFRAAFERLREEGRRAVLWGAGSKGVMFLNTLNLQGEPVRHVVDQNPRKHGRHVVGTGQVIVSPEQLRELQPDVVLIMNPIYRDEIAETLQQMQMSPELMLG